MKELILPSSLEALSLQGVQVENMQQIISSLHSLKSIAITLYRTIAEVPPLAPDLQEFTFYELPPSNLAFFSQTYQNLTQLRLLNILSLQQLIIADMQRLEELEVGVGNFKELQFLHLPFLKYLKVCRQFVFKFSGGLQEAIFVRDKSTQLIKPLKMMTDGFLSGQVSLIPSILLEDMDLSSLKHFSISEYQQKIFVKIKELLDRAVNLEFLSISEVPNQKNVELVVCHQKLKFLSFGQDNSLYKSSKIQTLTLLIKPECTALSQFIFKSSEYKLTLHLETSLWKAKILAKEANLKIAKSCKIQDLSLTVFKANSFRFFANVKICSLMPQSISSFQVPISPQLKRLILKVQNQASFRLLKAITSKAQKLEELQLSGLAEKTKDIEIVSDSLKCIDLRGMKMLTFIKLKGKAKPSKVGFTHTKLILQKK